MWLTHYTHLQNIDVDEVSLKKLKDTRKCWSDVTLTAHSLTLSCLCTNVTLEVKFFWTCQSKLQASMLPHAALFPPLFFPKYLWPYHIITCIFCLSCPPESWTLYILFVTTLHGGTCQITSAQRCLLNEWKTAIWYQNTSEESLKTFIIFKVNI